MSDESPITRFGSGREVKRVEDAALLRGAGRFTDDEAPAGQAVLVFLRSPHAHARIVAIDAEPARAIPGVLAVLTGDDLAAAGLAPLPGVAGFTRADGSPAQSPVRHALARDRVRHVGDPVAAVVALDRETARDAAEAIVVDYDPLPAVIDPAQALADGAERLVPEAPDNRCAERRHGDAAATDAAFAQAAHVARVRVVNQRLAPSSLEPRSVLAWLEAGSGRLTIRMSSQMPTGVRGTLAGMMGLAPEAIRVIVGDVGGGFGMKTGLYPEDAVVAFAARQLGRPVKWIADRGEELMSAVHGRDLETTAEMALDADGRVLGLRTVSHANIGAYGTPTANAIQLLVGPWVTTSIYDIARIDLRLTTVLTNTAPTGAYRGAGRPEAIFLIERLMDEAARVTGLDRVTVRRRNLIGRGRMPYRNPMDQVYDDGHFETVMDTGLALADWGGFAARRAESARRGRLRGLGLATFLEWTGGNALEETVSVDVAADGFIEIVSATQAMGQGIVTSYAQLAVDVFGVPIERIRIVQGDTDRANGFGSAGSRSLFTGGSAVDVAAKDTVRKAIDLAAEALEAAPTDIEYRDAVLRIAGTDRRIGLFELAAAQPQGRIRLDSTTRVAAPSWPNGCHVCEVEIDPQTGQTEVVRYHSMNDVGRVVNPVIVTGQLEGGALQGIGQALCEAVVYDPDSAQLLTGSFMDYAMPRADLAGPMRTGLYEDCPCRTNPLGVKGVGELGTIGATPAVVSAVFDALASAGRADAAAVLQMPLTAPKVWAALHGRPGAG